MGSAFSGYFADVLFPFSLNSRGNQFLHIAHLKIHWVFNWREEKCVRQKSDLCEGMRRPYCETNVNVVFFVLDWDGDLASDQITHQPSPDFDLIVAKTWLVDGSTRHQSAFSNRAQKCNADLFNMCPNATMLACATPWKLPECQTWPFLY